MPNRSRVSSGLEKPSPQLYKPLPLVFFANARPAENTRLLLGLEVVQEDGSLLRLLTPVLNDDARAVDDLAGVALTVEDA